MRQVIIVKGYPEPFSIIWQGPGGSSDTRTLIVDSVKRDAAGNYTCTAKNRFSIHGKSEQVRTAYKSTLVIVEYPPGKALIDPIEPAVVGQTVTLVKTEFLKILLIVSVCIIL